MPALGDRNHHIALSDAAGHTRRHRAAMAAAPTEADHASAFRGAELMELLLQEGCWGLRIYHGRDAKGTRSMVLVGVDEKGQDMTSGPLLEQGWPCPPFCDDESPLGA